MKLLELFLFEYKRDITQQKMGDKLVQAALRDRKQDIDTILTSLEEMDPTKHKNYVEWLCRQYIAGMFRLEDKPRVHTLLTQFDTAKRRNQVPEKDIGRYDYRQLRDTITPLFNAKVGDEEQSGVIPVVPDSEILYNGPLGQLAIPKTEEAAKALGKDTVWCTARDEDNLFSHYNSDGPLYVWIDGKTRKKYQFHFGDKEGMSCPQFMDVHDDPIKPELLNYFRTEHPILSKFFKKEEQQLLKDPFLTHMYTKYAIQGRWPEAEPTIRKNLSYAVSYAKDVIKGRWPEAESEIMKDPITTIDYAKDVIKGRWPEAESEIMKDPHAALSYAENVIKGRWPEAESEIMRDPFIAVHYAYDIMGGRWPEAESHIRKNKYAWSNYKSLTGYHETT